MNTITLPPIYAAKRMSRFYRLDVQLDLFGEWCFIREWGRTGQVRQRPFRSRARERS